MLGKGNRQLRVRRTCRKQEDKECTARMTRTAAWVSSADQPSTAVDECDRLSHQEVSSRKVGNRNISPDSGVGVSSSEQLSQIRRRKSSEILSPTSDGREKRPRRAVSPSSSIQKLRLAARARRIAATSRSIGNIKEKKSKDDKPRVSLLKMKTTNGSMFRCSSFGARSSSRLPRTFVVSAKPKRRSDRLRRKRESASQKETQTTHKTKRCLSNQLTPSRQVTPIPVPVSGELHQSSQSTCPTRSSTRASRHNSRRTTSNGSQGTSPESSHEPMSPKRQPSRGISRRRLIFEFVTDSGSIRNNRNLTSARARRRRSHSSKDSSRRTAGIGDSTDDLEIVYERIVSTANTDGGSRQPSIPNTVVNSAPSSPEFLPSLANSDLQQEEETEIDESIHHQQAGSNCESPSPEECVESAGDDSGRGRPRTFLRIRTRLVRFGRGRSVSKRIQQKERRMRNGKSRVAVEEVETMSASSVEDDDAENVSLSDCDLVDLCETNVMKEERSEEAVLGNTQRNLNEILEAILTIVTTTSTFLGGLEKEMDAGVRTGRREETEEEETCGDSDRNVNDVIEPVLATNISDPKKWAAESSDSDDEELIILGLDDGHDDDVIRTRLQADKAAASSTTSSPDGCPDSDTSRPHQTAAPLSTDPSPSLSSPPSDRDQTMDVDDVYFTPDRSSAAPSTPCQSPNSPNEPEHGGPRGDIPEDSFRPSPTLRPRRRRSHINSSDDKPAHRHSRKKRRIVHVSYDSKSSSADHAPMSKTANESRRKVSGPAKWKQPDETAMDEVDRIWAEWERMQKMEMHKTASETAAGLRLYSSPSKSEQFEIAEGAEVQGITVTTRDGSEKGVERHYWVDDAEGDRFFDDMVSFTDFEWTDLMTSLRDRIPRREADWMKVAARVGRTTEACRSAFRWVKEHYASTYPADEEEDMY